MRSVIEAGHKVERLSWPLDIKEKRQVITVRKKKCRWHEKRDGSVKGVVTARRQASLRLVSLVSSSRHSAVGSKLDQTTEG